MLRFGTGRCLERCIAMPMYETVVVNDEFVATSDSESADMRTAKRRALKGVLDVGSEQLLGDKAFFGCIVTVTDGTREERFIVSMGTSPLK